MNTRKKTTTPIVLEQVPGFEKAVTIGERIRIIREFKGITQKQLSEAVVGRDPAKLRSRTSVSQWERGRSEPPYDKLTIISDFLSVPPEYLAFGITNKGRAPAPDIAVIREVTYDSPNKRVDGRSWGLPNEYIRSDLHASDADKLVIFRVEVDDENYGRDDLVIVDTGNVRPAPPGTFLYWNGYNATLARISVIPASGSKQMLRIESEGNKFEIAADKVQILGRVKGKLART